MTKPTKSAVASVLLIAPVATLSLSANQVETARRHRAEAKPSAPIYLVVDKKRIAPLWTRVVTGRWAVEQPAAGDRVLLVMEGTNCVARDSATGGKLWIAPCGDAPFYPSVQTEPEIVYLLEQRRMPSSQSSASKRSQTEGGTRQPAAPDDARVRVVNARTGKETASVVLKQPPGAVNPGRATGWLASYRMLWEAAAGRVFVEWPSDCSNKEGVIDRFAPTVCAYQPGKKSVPLWTFEPKEEKEGEPLRPPHQQMGQVSSYWRSRRFTGLRTAREGGDLLFFVPFHGARLWCIDAATGKVLAKKGPAEDLKGALNDKHTARGQILGEDAWYFIGASVWNYDLTTARRFRDATCTISAGPYIITRQDERQAILIGLLRRFQVDGGNGISDEYALVEYSPGRAPAGAVRLETTGVLPLPEPLIGHSQIADVDSICGPMLDGAFVCIRSWQSRAFSAPVFLFGSAKDGPRIEWLTRIGPAGEPKADWTLSAPNISQWKDLGDGRLLLTAARHGRDGFASGHWQHTLILMGHQDGRCLATLGLHVDAPVVDMSGRPMSEDQVRRRLENKVVDERRKIAVAVDRGAPFDSGITRARVQQLYFGSIVGSTVTAREWVVATFHAEETIRVSAFSLGDLPKSGSPQVRKTQDTILLGKDRRMSRGELSSASRTWRGGKEK